MAPKGTLPLRTYRVGLGLALTLLPIFSQESVLGLTASVQSGTLTSNVDGTQTVTITPVDPTKAFLIFQTRHDRNRPPQSMLRGRIASATTLEFARVTDQSSAIEIQWYVVEYASGVRVQRGEISSQASTAMTIPILPVGSSSQAFVTWSKTPSATNNGFDDRHPILMEVAPPPAVPDHLNLRAAAAASAHVIWWQLIEFLNPAHVAVQRGSTSLAVSDLSVEATLPTPVNVNTTFVLVGYTSQNPGATIGACLIRAQLIDATTVRIDRSISGVELPEIVWQVVELKDGSKVQRGSESMPLGVAQSTVTINPVDVLTATAFASAQPVGGQNTGRSSLNTDDVIGVASATLSVSSSSLTLNRDNTSAPTDIGWFVVEWGSDVDPPLVTGVLPDTGSHLGGDAVTFFGSGFGATTTVEFDGIPGASPTVISENSLSALSPPHAPGRVDITVSNEAGSSTLPQGYTYNPIPTFMRGDANVDGTVNVADGIYIVQYLFAPPAPEPTCFDAADTNDDGDLNISDIVYSLAFLFQRGNPPAQPFPDCGMDNTLDSFDCALFPPC